MSLTIKKAETIVNYYYKQKSPSKQEETKMLEALQSLIQDHNDTNAMMKLGAWYYATRKYDLALHYYTMAASEGCIESYKCLGYIYYYGCVNGPDYKKAYHYFKQAADQGDLIAGYKIADMYYNGYYVKKDIDKYCAIIKTLYEQVCNSNDLFSPLPEIYTRLSKIYVHENKKQDAIRLLLIAKDFLSQRLIYSTFFGDLDIMKHLIKDLYALTPFDTDDISLFDLYYILQNPAMVSLHIDGCKYQVQSFLNQQGEIEIQMNGEHYEDIDAFFRYATIEGTNISTMYRDINVIEVIKRN